VKSAWCACAPFTAPASAGTAAPPCPTCGTIAPSLDRAGQWSASTSALFIGVGGRFTAHHVRNSFVANTVKIKSFTLVDPGNSDGIP
jgi:hypothetical protein